MAITICRAVIIYFFVILAVRVMGRRQIGELSTHDFVITILISSVATIPLEDNEIPLANSLLPILIFISLEILESALSMKSQGFRNLLEGKPIFIIKDGKLNQQAMKKLRITLSDLLNNLRGQQIFDIAEVENAIVETNGKISVQKKTDGQSVPVPVVTDGTAVNEYFSSETFSEDTIRLLAAKSGLPLQEIMLLTVDENGNTYLIKKEKDQ